MITVSRMLTAPLRVLTQHSLVVTRLENSRVVVVAGLGAIAAALLALLELDKVNLLQLGRLHSHSNHQNKNNIIKSTN